MGDQLNRLKEEVDARKLAAELAGLRDVEAAARNLVSFCYTSKSGREGWRGEMNMKGILSYASDLRFALDRLNGSRKEQP